MGPLLHAGLKRNEAVGLGLLGFLLAANFGERGRPLGEHDGHLAQEVVEARLVCVVRNVQPLEAHAPRADLHFVRGPSADVPAVAGATRSEEHTSELQSLMRISYAV